MYLRRAFIGCRQRFAVAESYRDQGTWRHRELCDLGADPGGFIEYCGGNSFYIREDLQQRLAQTSSNYDPGKLERLFYPFLDPEIRRIVEMFDRPASNRRRWRGRSEAEIHALQQDLHTFDKRRLHYLRCGRVDIGDLDGRAWKFLNVLLEKSRDELEHLFADMEQVLPPREIRAYLYTALHLQTHFHHLCSRNHPGAIDPERMDHFFLEDLCRLNQDAHFFSGVERRDAGRLHPYLVRYLILYFDHDMGPDFEWDADIQDFISRRRAAAQKGGVVSHGLSKAETEACRYLSIDPALFRDMPRAQLVHCYRRAALREHPDTGGDHEAFVQIKEAYECLIRLKP